MLLANRERSHLRDFVFSDSLPLSYQLCLCSFGPAKTSKNLIGAEIGWSGTSKGIRNKGCCRTTPNKVTVLIFRLSASFSSSFLMASSILMGKAGNVMDHCTHPNVINHVVCSQGGVTLERFCVFRLFFGQQLIVSEQFCPRENSKKNTLMIYVVRFFCG